MLAALVVGRVVVAVGLDVAGQRAAMTASTSGLRRIEGSTSGRILVRRKWSGQEVPSAASGRRSFATDEFQHRGAVVEMAELAARPGRDQAADARHQPRRDRAAALGGGSGCDGCAAEGRLAARSCCSNQAMAWLMMSMRGLVAVLRRVAPGEQAVAFEHDALGASGSPAQNLPSLRPSSKPALPRQPADLVAEDLLRSAPCESFDAAIAMIASGCMWSTCACGT